MLVSVQTDSGQILLDHVVCPGAIQHDAYETSLLGMALLVVFCFSESDLAFCCTPCHCMLTFWWTGWLPILFCWRYGEYYEVLSGGHLSFGSAQQTAAQT